MPLSKNDTNRIEKQWHRISRELDPVERTTIANALRIAADQYDKDAAANRREKAPRVADRFQEQCDHCRLIADCVDP